VARRFDQTCLPGTASFQKSCREVWVAAAATFSPLSTYHHGVVGKGESSFSWPQGIIEDGWNNLWGIFRLKMVGVIFSLLYPSVWCGAHKTKAISM